MGVSVASGIERDFTFSIDRGGTFTDVYAEVWRSRVALDAVGKISIKCLFGACGKAVVFLARAQCTCSPLPGLYLG